MSFLKIAVFSMADKFISVLAPADFWLMSAGGSAKGRNGYRRWE
jgi:hypothetical protein